MLSGMRMMTALRVPIRAFATATEGALPPRTLILNDLRDNPGAVRPIKRVGRGIGSGMGHTATRGMKGQKSRSGSHLPAGFEGGQTPLHRRIPKSGFKNKFPDTLEQVRLDQIMLWVRTGRLDATQPITMKHLFDAGIVSSVKHGVKVLQGKGPVTLPLKLEVSQASQGAIADIEAAGGSIVTKYYAPLALRALLKPHKFDIIPKSPAPPPRKMEYYTSDANRGYLSQKVAVDALAK